jgi:hypothetical protein
VSIAKFRFTITRYKNSYIRNVGNATKVDKTVSYLVKNIRINISYFLFIVREIIVLSSKILLPIFLKASISTIEKMAEQDDKYKNTMLWIAGRLEKESGFIINPDFRDDILNFTNKHSNKTVEEK